MSESKRTLEDSSLQSSGNSRDEEADCRVSNEISLLSEPLDLSIRKDAVGSEPDNQNNREGENEEHEVESHANAAPVEDTRDTVDDAEQKSADTSIGINNRYHCDGQIKRSCPTCKITIADAKVSIEQWCAKCGTVLDFECARCDRKFDAYSKLTWHQQSCSTVINYNCSRCEYTTKNQCLLFKHKRRVHEDESIATSSRKKASVQINRFCPTCKITIANANMTPEQLCIICKTELTYQCARCNKEYTLHGSANDHVKTCNPQKQDLNCPLCDAPADTKVSMERHLRFCLKENHFRCCFCEYTDARRSVLRRHLTTVHEDVLKMDCSQHNAEPNKCEQCKKKVTICETCRTCFSSTDGFQEHLQSCKLPELRCIFCSFYTEVIENYKWHLMNAHLSDSTSQN